MGCASKPLCYNTDMKLKLIAVKPETGNVKTFVFEPEKPVKWIAGQFMHYGLPKPDDVDDTMERYFTISSAPHTGTPQITTRISRTPFKQALKALKIGDTIDAREPEGDFIWEDHDRPMVFIAGGIGITPFHSILAERAHSGKSMNVTLVYANRNQDIIFKEELDALDKAYKDFKIKYIIGHPLDIKAVVKAVPHLEDCMVYLSGAEPMVEEISELLDKEVGLSKSQLKQDFFPGYNYDTF